MATTNSNADTRRNDLIKSYLYTLPGSELTNITKDPLMIASPSLQIPDFKVKYVRKEALVQNNHIHPHSTNPQEELLIKKAKKAGGQAARLGYHMPTDYQLKMKQYNDAQINAFKEAFHKVCGDEREQMKRRISLAGYQAAIYGCKRPDEKKLLSKGYTAEQVTIYYEAYDNTVGNEYEQRLRKVKRQAYQLSRSLKPRPTRDYLVSKYGDHQLANTFYEIFDLNRSKLVTYDSI